MIGIKIVMSREVKDDNKVGTDDAAKPDGLTIFEPVREVNIDVPEGAKGEGDDEK